MDKCPDVKAADRNRLVCFRVRNDPDLEVIVTDFILCVLLFFSAFSELSRAESENLGVVRIPKGPAEVVGLQILLRHEVGVRFDRFVLLVVLGGRKRSHPDKNLFIGEMF